MENIIAFPQGPHHHVMASARAGRPERRQSEPQATPPTIEVVEASLRELLVEVRRIIAIHDEREELINELLTALEEAQARIVTLTGSA